MTEYWLNVTYACGFVGVLNGKVVETCPIFKWMIGKSWENVLINLKSKKQFLEFRELEVEAF